VATASTVLLSSRRFSRERRHCSRDRLLCRLLAKAFGVALDDGMIPDEPTPSQKKLKIAFALGLLRISPFVCDCWLK